MTLSTPECKQLRDAVCRALVYAGCSCCRNDKEYSPAIAEIARLLKVPKFRDGSGFNFYKYAKRKP